MPTMYSGRRYQRWETGPIYGDLLRAGDRIVVGGGPKNGAAPGKLISVPDDLRSHDGTSLSDAGHIYFPSVDGRSLWTVDGEYHRPAVATRRDPDTGAVLQTLAPTRWLSDAVAIVQPGFLVVGLVGDDRSSSIGVIETSKPQRRRLITRNASSFRPVLAATAGLVAWQGPGNCNACQLHLTSLSTGHTKTVVWNPPQRFLCDSGSLSPDGRWLAVEFGCPRPDFDGQAPLLLVNTKTARGHLIPGSANQVQGAPVWSTTGDWVMWQQAGYLHRTVIRAYHPGRYRPHSFSVPRNPGELLQALPVPGTPAGPSSYAGP